MQVLIMGLGLQALFPDLEGLGLAAGVEYNKFYVSYHAVPMYTALPSAIILTPQ